VSTLQLGLIVAGVLLVIGVIVYNQWQERRLKRLTASAAPTDLRTGRTPERVEPTLGAAAAAATADDAVTAFRGGDATDGTFEPPADVIASPAGFVDGEDDSAETRAPVDVAAPPAHSSLTASRASPGARAAVMPDHEIECLIPLQPAAPVAASAIGAGFGARIGKALRWFGRADARSDWQRLAADTPGRFGEIVACLLLADRNGAASRAQIDTFVRIVGDIAPTLPAAFSPPDIAQEVARAESLDRLCAELDVQIGLTVQKPDPGSIAGTRLRGVAEAAGFRLAPGGRFELAHEETGAVLYTLQNLRPDPFTAESLRLTATNGVVFLLDVARTADPLRTFDQMKLAAKRMAVTLGGELVDDNHRPLDDAAFAVIREQVNGAADALRAVHIEPGSARALALFSA
jgi:FtsZ-interacting cell division protein ZipA